MQKLEKMDTFFAARLNGYDEHMKRDIIGATEFYPFTASLLPQKPKAKVLDLGCGTGLELEDYFMLNPQAEVTGIDLSKEMLNSLKAKFSDRNITLIQASYFDEPFGENKFDAAVSVESLHHFPADMKLNLYRKLYLSLTKEGYFVLTDYFAESEKAESEYFHHLKMLKQKQGLADDAFYHYDTPLTVEHETEVLRRAGFSSVDIIKNWEATFTLIVKKSEAQNYEQQT